VQISDEFVEKLIADLRAENAALLEIILQQQKLLPETDDEIVAIPEVQAGFGRKPWYLRKRDLEKAYAKPQLSEIAGIPDMEITQDANQELG
jgi:hypothetical protein